MKHYLHLLLVIVFSVFYLTTTLYSQNKVFQKITKYVKNETNAGKKVTASDLESLFKTNGIGDTITYGKESNSNYTGLADLSVAALDSTHFVFAFRDTGDRDCGVVKIGEISNNRIDYGCEYTFNCSGTFSISVASLSDTSFVVAFQDSYNSDYGTIVKGTMANNGLEFGYKAVFNEGLTTDISITALADDNFIVAYRNGGNLGYGTARAGDATYGYSTSFGDTVVFNRGNTSDISVKSFDGINTMIAYCDNDDSNFGHGVAVNVVGNVIILGMDIPFNIGVTSDISLDTFNNSTFVIVYRDIANSGFSIVGNIAFPQLTLGQGFPFSTTPISDISLSVIDDISFMVAYCDSISTNLGIVKIVDIYGTILNTDLTNSFFSNGAVSNISVAALNDKDFVIAYEDPDNYINGKALSGEVVNGSLTYGNITPINLGTSSYNSIAALDPVHFVVTYSDFGNSEYGVAVIGEVLGDTIKYGEKFVFDERSVNEVVVTALDPAHFVVAYLDTRDSFAGILKVGEVSGTTITFGSKQPFSKSAKSLAINSLDPLTFVLAFVSLENNVQAVATICNVTGTVIDGGINYGFKKGEVENISVEPLNNASFIIAYRDINNSNSGSSIVGEVSGTVITFGDEVVFNNSGSYWISVSALDPTRVLVAFSDASNLNYGTLVMGNVAGNIITYGNPIIFNPDATKFISVLALANSKFVVVNASGNGYLTSDLPKMYVGDVFGGAITVVEKNTFYEKNLGYQTTFLTKLFSEGDESKIVIGYIDARNRTGATKIGWINDSTPLLFAESDNYITKYELAQNYPNPFNPTTTIQFTIPKAGMVSLKVYNILGEEVATLINKEMNAGNQKINFDASYLSSGLYFYRISAGDFVGVKKMMLLK